MILIILLLVSILSGITTYVLTTLFAMMLNDTFNVLEIYTKYTPFILLDKYSPNKSFKRKWLRILSMYEFYITGCAGIILCMIIHRILYEVFEDNKSDVDQLLNDIKNVIANEAPKYIFEPLEFQTQENKTELEKPPTKVEELSDTSDNWLFIIDKSMENENYFNDVISEISNFKDMCVIEYAETLQFTTMDQIIYDFAETYSGYTFIVITDKKNEEKYKFSTFKDLILFIDSEKTHNDSNYIHDTIMNKMNML